MNECVWAYVGLVIQRAMGHVVMCGLFVYHISPHCIINGQIFGKQGQHKMCVLTFSTTFI